MVPYCGYMDYTLSLKQYYSFKKSNSLLPGLVEPLRTRRDEHGCSTWEQNLRPHSDLLSHHILMGPASTVSTCSSLKGKDSNSLYQAFCLPNHSSNCRQNYLPKTQGDTAVSGPQKSLLSSVCFSV